MDTSPNFAFLAQEFPQIAESATFAELHALGDPRAALFHARHALERLIKRIYKLDKTLSPPPRQNLDSYITGESFLELVPDVVWQKMEYIRKSGNDAVHSNKQQQSDKAAQVVQELYHVAYWAGRSYLRQGAKELKGVEYNKAIAVTNASPAAPIDIKELERLKQEKDQLDEKLVEQALELEALQKQIEQTKAENDAVPETHDWNEAETRKRIIDLELRRAGWTLGQPHDREYEVTGMPSDSGIGYADYVLWGDDGKPLAVVEAKKTTVDAKTGQQQAKLYADCLETMHQQRPVIFYSNGYQHFIWDDSTYPPREVSGFYKKDELASLIHRRKGREPIDVKQIKDEISNRYYQKRAIGSIGAQFVVGKRQALLVMATGTGKTRTAISLVDVLQRAGWVKRALFLADRVSLVRQAINAFKDHLPESSPVNLVTDKEATGRVYASTYPTMMGLIDDTKGGEARFGVGHFDLIIIDEAHRSVYERYREIFRYFDSLLVGLTATPREQVDRNTYELFDLTLGEPTDAYELETAVSDEFLVPPKVDQVEMKFPRDGIDYDSLSEEEKLHWESLDWGDDVDEHGMPTQVNAGAINKWLFNADTVDQVLKYLMMNGHYVDGGDLLAKTILFARNRKHAEFIEERFNQHYPQYKGNFARVIDHKAPYVQSLIEDFSVRDKDPHLALSVDMLDTGIDVPEVANLVFFKPVYSKIKFWQMIGRGTRLCPDLFGPGDDKKDFRIFDFCFNFEFFKENPNGIEGTGAVPLGTRLFLERVELLSGVRKTPEVDDLGGLAKGLSALLYAEVSAMNPENFIVRTQLESVRKFQTQTKWDKLSDEDVIDLQNNVAGLPSELKRDDIKSRMFDLIALRMQLALLLDDKAGYEKNRKRVVEIASALEVKTNIPAVKDQLSYLAAMQETVFWEGINLNLLEELRLRLRELVPFLDKQERKIVYTDFKDEITGSGIMEPIEMPNMTSQQYRRKVESYLTDHLDQKVIKRLRSHEPVTQTELAGLEQKLIEIGEVDGQDLLAGMLERSESLSLAHLVLRMVGLDRKAAQKAFSEFLNDESLTAKQIRFVEMIIDQLTSRGTIEPDALYESPFISLHGGGPEGLFGNRTKVVNAIFEALKNVEPRISY